jgi:hypothetical protein
MKFVRVQHFRNFLWSETFLRINKIKVHARELAIDKRNLLLTSVYNRRFDYLIKTIAVFWNTVKFYIVYYSCTMAFDCRG